MKSESKIVINGYILPAATIAFGAIAAVTGNAAVTTTTITLSWIIIVMMALLFFVMAANAEAVKNDIKKKPRTPLQYVMSAVVASTLFFVLAINEAAITATVFAVTYFMLMLLRITLDKR